MPETSVRNWYYEFFDPENKAPYSTEEEAETDMLCLIDIFLNLAFQYKEDLSDHMEMRGLVITPQECEYALTDRTRHHREKGRQLLASRHWEREQLNQAWNHLECRKNAGRMPRLWDAVSHFQLSRIETLGFFLALSVEYDRKYERIFGYLQDNVAVKLPTVGLLLSLYELFEPGIARISSESPLFQQILEETEGDETCSRLSRPMRVKQEIMEYLAGRKWMPKPGRLEHWAVKVPLIFTWEDLILPEEQKLLLHQMSGRLRYHKKVDEDWGFARKTAYGRGVSAVFYGVPGTGKTMAAQIIASELNLELYKIDVSMLLSKYIGETEKNLHEIFKEAEKKKAVLLFDEAEGLFARRTEITSSNDRFANTETGYLLQKFEEYNGVCILTTNYPGSMDDAFRRRLTYMIRFPFPDEKSRLRLWKSMLPPETPLAEALDFEYLARTFEMTGSEIKEALIQAAYLAAGEQDILSNHYLGQALQMVFAKYNRNIPANTLEYLI